MQTPDIGGMVLEHTADSRVVELPFDIEWHLPSNWYLWGINVSPTKHVVFMAFAAVMVLVTLIVAARSIERRHRLGKAPAGFGGAIEALVLFLRDEIAIANIGPAGAKFAPYIAALFFFILYCNLLGLFPWGTTPTGNVAVTGTLAITAFLAIEVSGMVALGPAGYIRTIVMVPKGMKGIGAVMMALIMTPVELIGKFVKPFALCLRLFANMTSGHFVILSLLGLIFLFGTTAYVRWFVAGFATGFVLFMMALELFVAFLQAYIFALLTSVFIGLMQHEH